MPIWAKVNIFLLVAFPVISITGWLLGFVAEEFAQSSFMLGFICAAIISIVMQEK